MDLVNLDTIYVSLVNHDLRYDISALIKSFYNNVNIIFLEEQALKENQSLFIESILMQNKAITRMLKNGQVVEEFEDNIDTIDIKVDDRDKIEKMGIKKSLFSLLSKVTNTKVPWGVLTGIRPTKIVHNLLDNSFDDETIENILTREYKLNIDKAILIIDIAKRERKFIYPLDEDKYSIYISIPFCPTRCLYCSFPSNDIEKTSNLVDEYTEKLIYEMKKVSEIMINKTLDTVYIGGGTPTAIPAKNLEKIIQSVYYYFGTKMREFTVEAGRPDTINLEILQMLKNNNINRISINPQTMNLETLKTIGRDHTPEEIIESFNLAKQIGFDSINMDLIVGLPGEDKTSVEKTMKYIKELRPENLTVHTMAVKRASKLREEIDKYSLTEQNPVEEMLDITRSYAKELGMNPYYMYRQKQILGNFENVGYSIPGKECIYNMLIMEEKQTIVALGAGAITKVYFPSEDRLERVPNVKDLRVYIDRVDDMIEKKKKYFQ